MRLVLLAIQMLLLLVPAGAEDAFRRYLDPSSLTKLREGRTVSASIASDGELTLAPSIASRDAIAADIKDRKATLGVEVLRIMTGLPQALDTKDGWLLLFNSLHAVSTMKGIPYYSVTRSGTQTLFSESYAVDPVSRKDRISDPVFADIPATDLFFTFQEDKTFGKNFYEESFSYKPDHLVVRIVNLSTISFLFIPLIQPRNLVSEVALIPNGSELVFYGVSCLTTSFPMGDRQSREESLSNRLLAMANWLKTRLERAASGRE